MASPEAIRLMVQALKTVPTKEGTAVAAHLDHYTVAGKTGTAQKVEHGKYVQRFYSSFIGFFPADNPELCIAVIMDDPKDKDKDGHYVGHFGGVIDGPIFHAIAERAANYKNLTPDVAPTPSGNPNLDRRHKRGAPINLWNRARYGIHRARDGRRVDQRLAHALRRPHLHRFTPSRTGRFVLRPGRRVSRRPHFLVQGASGLERRHVVAEQRSKLPPDFNACPAILVNNTRRALGSLAAAYRSEFNLPVVAVGGSNGKTTTKELIASVLRQKKATLWSEASFNNDVGVPLTLLRLERAHQAAVLEAGTNHPGELTPLLKMMSPRFGVVTNIGREHLEFFHDLVGVVREEGTVAECLPTDGVLFLNGDNPWSEILARRTRARVVQVGLERGNDCVARDVRVDENGTAFNVDCRYPGLSGEYRIKLLGRHQVTNAMLALAVGAEMGLKRAEIENGLLACAPAKMRLQMSNPGGIHVLDDSYNANADSMLAALQTLRELPCAGRRVAVLGDMAELGDCSRAAHFEVGRRAAASRLDKLFAIGKPRSAENRRRRALQGFPKRGGD